MQSAATPTYATTLRRMETTYRIMDSTGETPLLASPDWATRGFRCATGYDRPNAAVRLRVIYVVHDPETRYWKIGQTVEHDRSVQARIAEQAQGRPWRIVGLAIGVRPPRPLRRIDSVVHNLDDDLRHAMLDAEYAISVHEPGQGPGSIGRDWVTLCVSVPLALDFLNTECDKRGHAWLDFRSSSIKKPVAYRTARSQAKHNATTGLLGYSGQMADQQDPVLAYVKDNDGEIAPSTQFALSDESDDNNYGNDSQATQSIWNKLSASQTQARKRARPSPSEAEPEAKTAAESESESESGSETQLPSHDFPTEQISTLDARFIGYTVNKSHDALRNGSLVYVPARARYEFDPVCNDSFVKYLNALQATTGLVFAQNSDKGMPSTCNGYFGVVVNLQYRDIRDTKYAEFCMVWGKDPTQNDDYEVPVRRIKPIASVSDKAAEELTRLVAQLGSASGSSATAERQASASPDYFRLKLTLF